VAQFSAAGGSKGTWSATNSTSFTLTTGNNVKKTGYAFYAQATPATNSFGISQTAISTFTSATSCAVTLSNVQQGQLGVVGIGAHASGGLQTFQVGDTLDTTWSAPISESANSAAEDVYIWWGYFPSSASTETVTMTFQAVGGGSASGSGFCGGYHLFGMQSFSQFMGVGGGTTSTSLATASTAFSGSPYIAISFASIAASQSWTAGSDFNLIDSGTPLGNSEYSTTVSSATTFPLTIGGQENWAEAGLVISRGIPGANLYLQDSTTGLPFSIGGYQGSTAEIDYSTASGLPPTYYKLNMSETIVDLHDSVLVKVSVGGSAPYYVSIVPSTEPDDANITMYLASPSIEVHYQMAISDQTGDYPPGTQVVIDSSGDQVRSSGYEAADFTYSAWLPPGDYTITFTKGSNTYTGILSAGASQSITVPIITKVVNTPSAISQSVFLWVGWNAATNQVQAQYNDTTGTTTQVNVTLYVFNSTCIAPSFCATGFAFSTKGSYGTVTLSLSGNLNYASQYFVEYTVASDYLCPEIGLTTVCTFGPTYVANNAFPTQNNPVGSTGISLALLFGPSVSSYFPNWVNGTSFLSYFVLLGTALAFGRRYSWVALIAVAVEGTILSGLGWFGIGATLAPELLGTIAISGVIGYMVLREKRGSF
jgi:hypothetical protein